MQYSQLPTKWVKPFAVDDANKVELPVTTAVLGRASQSLGFPPITMQPPESGGVPPQGEDFNGAMYQVARFTWWGMGGGPLPFDATWAANAAITGYPQGARIAAADLMGEWVSTADNNQNNPDTVGTNWVPGSSYGATVLTGLTNANVTLTPAQAAKPILRLSGTLTGNIQIIFPIWLSEWLIVNNCTGAFSVTVKTAAGSGVVVSQAGGQQTVWGDGTNLNALGGNAALPLVVGTPSLATHAAQFAQTPGVVGSMRNARMSVLTSAASGTFTADEIIVETALGGTRYCLANYSQIINLATTGAGGMDTGAAPASGYVALYAIYNPATGASSILATNATSAAKPNIYNGANMPAGYTASALIGIWGTTAGNLFRAGFQSEREVFFGFTSVLNAGTATVYTSFSLAAAVPLGAKKWGGSLFSAPTNANNGTYLTADAVGNSGNQSVNSPVANQGVTAPVSLPIITAQTAYYQNNGGGGTASITVNRYEF